MFAIARVIGVISVPYPMACSELDMNMDCHKTIACQGVVHQAAQNRTMEAAECVLKGMDMPSAAPQLGFKISTADTHLRCLFEKTGVKSQRAHVAVLLGNLPPG